MLLHFMWIKQLNHVSGIIGRHIFSSNGRRNFSRLKFDKVSSEACSKIECDGLFNWAMFAVVISLCRSLA